MKCSGARKSARRRVSRVLSRPLEKSRDGDGHSSGTLVAERLVRPTRAATRRFARHLRIAPGCLPLLLGLAPGGVFPAAAVAGGAVRSYRTVSTLPPARHAGDGMAVYFLWHFPWGRPRRALPGTVPPWSPDFPLPAQPRKAAIRPSGQGNVGRCAAFVKARSPLPLGTSTKKLAASRSCVLRDAPSRRPQHEGSL